MWSINVVYLIRFLMIFIKNYVMVKPRVKLWNIVSESSITNIFNKQNKIDLTLQKSDRQQVSKAKKRDSCNPPIKSRVYRFIKSRICTDDVCEIQKSIATMRTASLVWFAYKRNFQTLVQVKHHLNPTHTTKTEHYIESAIVRSNPLYVNTKRRYNFDCVSGPIVTFKFFI